MKPPTLLSRYRALRDGYAAAFADADPEALSQALTSEARALVSLPAPTALAPSPTHEEPLHVAEGEGP